MDSHLSRQLTAHSPRGQARSVVLQGQADECPRCHRSLVPKVLQQVLKSDAPDSDLEETCQCTSPACGGVFIAAYRCQRPGNPTHFVFFRAMPQEPISPQVQPEVAAASPTFVDVYTQALAAEASGLHQLTGIGLRKALEFLVKDFAVMINDAGEHDAIRKKSLAACIKDYIGDASVQAVAKRAAWLGNDETHYLRRWEGKDIEDLKTLIRLTMNGMDNILLSRRYVADMPEAK
jgi:hypothetical protein